ncbi:MAG: hypothetical protein ISS66_17540 [Desulfobacteraceae bacterium]|nr:hypothetical protein [Desulfobacteraceae bacterium]
MNPPPGCAVQTRCPEREDACTQSEPSFRDLGDGHFVACHRR